MPFFNILHGNILLRFLKLWSICSSFFTKMRLNQYLSIYGLMSERTKSTWSILIIYLWNFFLWCALKSTAWWPVMKWLYSGKHFRLTSVLWESEPFYYCVAECMFTSKVSNNSHSYNYAFMVFFVLLLCQFKEDFHYAAYWVLQLNTSYKNEKLIRKLLLLFVIHATFC